MRAVYLVLAILIACVTDGARACTGMPPDMNLSPDQAIDDAEWIVRARVRSIRPMDGVDFSQSEPLHRRIQGLLEKYNDQKDVFVEQ